MKTTLSILPTRIRPPMRRFSCGQGKFRTMKRPTVLDGRPNSGKNCCRLKRKSVSKKHDLRNNRLSCCGGLRKPTAGRKMHNKARRICRGPQTTGMGGIVGILIRTPIIPITTDTGIIDTQNTITGQMAEFTIINDLNFAKGITVSTEIVTTARVTTFASTLKRLSLAVAGSIKNSTPVDIISGRVTSKARGIHGFGAMPAVELILTGISTVASGDAIDFDPGQGRLGMRKGAANLWASY